MLYRQTWTKPEIYSLEGFIAWLETQRGDIGYDWMDINHCVTCQYLRSRGISDVHGSDSTIGMHQVFPNLHIYHEVCATEPWTFEAALHRAKIKLEDIENN